MQLKFAVVTVSGLLWAGITWGSAFGGMILSQDQLLLLESSCFTVSRVP